MERVLNKFKNTIASKLFILTLLLSIFPIAILIFFISANINDQFVSLATQDLYGRASVMGRELSLLSTPEEIETLLRDNRFEEWDYFFLSKKTPSQILSKKKMISEEVYADLSEDQKQRVQNTEGGVIIDKAMGRGIAYNNRPENDFIVLTVADISAIYKIISEIERSALIQLTLSLIIIALIDGVLVFMILSPIKELVSATKKISSGSFDVAIKEEDLDGEMRTLASGFNKMVLDLKRSRDKVERYSKELEGKVSERTREIEAKNKELSTFNKIAVGRELKMIHLKKQIRELEEKLAEKDEG